MAAADASNELLLADGDEAVKVDAQEKLAVARRFMDANRIIDEIKNPEYKLFSVILEPKPVVVLTNEPS
jgi:hypothetical protein